MGIEFSYNTGYNSGLNKFSNLVNNQQVTSNTFMFSGSGISSDVLEELITSRRDYLRDVAIENRNKLKRQYNKLQQDIQEENFRRKKAIIKYNIEKDNVEKAERKREQAKDTCLKYQRILRNSEDPEQVNAITKKLSSEIEDYKRFCKMSESNADNLNSQIKQVNTTTQNCVSTAKSSNYLSSALMKADNKAVRFGADSVIVGNMASRTFNVDVSPADTAQAPTSTATVAAVGVGVGLGVLALQSAMPIIKNPKTIFGKAINYVAQGASGLVSKAVNCVKNSGVYKAVTNSGLYKTLANSGVGKACKSIIKSKKPVKALIAAGVTGLIVWGANKIFGSDDKKTETTSPEISQQIQTLEQANLTPQAAQENIIAQDNTEQINQQEQVVSIPQEEIIIQEQEPPAATATVANESSENLEDLSNIDISDEELVAENEAMQKEISKTKNKYESMVAEARMKTSQINLDNYKGFKYLSENQMYMDMKDEAKKLTYTIKPGDKTWNIVKEELTAKNNQEPTNNDIVNEIKLRMENNGIECEAKNWHIEIYPNSLNRIC